MISVKNLVKRFGAREAVRDVSFDVEPGVVLGFLGPNGAGKTTTMRMITGFLSPTSGSAFVRGLDVTEHPVETRKLIGYLPENAPMYTEMTVEEFLGFVAEVRGYDGVARAKAVDEVIEKTFLSGVRHQSIETLSKGYKQRTAFAQAILHDPPVLILDEPTEGLDPNQKHVVRSMIRHMSREKVIILSTHVLEEVEAICSRVIIISDGRLVADATPAELKARGSTHHAVYLELGGDAAGVSDELSGLEEVDRVEVLEAPDACARFRVYPKNRASIVGAVSALSHSKGWNLQSMRTEEGRLNEVFMSLTTTSDVSEKAKEVA
jgi:ABC-2 type transport system ATP-binding protein